MQPRSRQRRLPKYQPVSPPIRRIGRNACAGGDWHVHRAGVDQTLAVSDAAVALRLQARGGDRVRPAGFRELAVLVRESPRDRLPVAARLDREGASGVRASDDGLVGKAVDQLATDAGVDGRHEPEPEARQPGGEERHRDDPAAEAELPRVLAHQLLVGDLVGAADLEHRAALELDVERCDEVVEHVLDRDRLRLGAHPARRDHHRQALDELAEHLEGEASRADHDRGPELDRLHARVGENAADFLATREVAREIAAGAEPAQVDDPTHARLARRSREVGGATTVLLLEARRRRSSNGRGSRPSRPPASPGAGTRARGRRPSTIVVVSR